MSNINVNNLTPLLGSGSSVSVSGSLVVKNDVTIGGHLYIGDQDTDSVTFSAEVRSSLVPDANVTYDLGSSDFEWKDLYIDGTANIDTLVADNITNSALSTSVSGSTYSAIFTTSASVASIRFKNLPTDVSQARLIATGSLYLSGSEQNDSKALFVFTG